MYCKDRQIVNIDIYKYVRRRIRKFKLLFQFSFKNQNSFVCKLKIDS